VEVLFLGEGVSLGGLLGELLGVPLGELLGVPLGELLGVPLGGLLGGVDDTAHVLTAFLVFLALASSSA